MGIFRKIFGSEEVDRKYEELKAACRSYEACQKELKNKAGVLYHHRKQSLKHILYIMEKLATFQHLPKWCLEDIAAAVDQIKDFRAAVAYENDPKKFAELTDSTGRTAAFIGTGTVAGAAIATLGPSVAMSIATVLGTASTGTAISALSGVAATNAALAWLGGGAVAAGGGGIAGGTLMLGMFGPIGLAVGAVSAVGGMMLMKSKHKSKLAEIEKNIDTIKRDTETLAGKLRRLSELIARSENHDQNRLRPLMHWMETVSPKDYSQWNDDNKHALEKLVNAVSVAAQRINERI